MKLYPKQDVIVTSLVYLENLIRANITYEMHLTASHVPGLFGLDSYTREEEKCAD